MPDSQSPRPYPHWMLREIYEQPEALASTLAAYIEQNAFTGPASEAALNWLRDAEEVVILASGSSRHAGMVAETLIEAASGLPVDVEYASEYVFREDRAIKRASVLVISQSGETADTLAALRHAASRGHQTLAISNVISSTMAREATVSFPTLAGRERAIPATKSFTAQLLNVSLLALLAAKAKKTMDQTELENELRSLNTLPALIRQQLDAWKSVTEKLAVRYREVSSLLFLGRDVHYPIAREGALKLKESAYLHAEGYPSGELKHGPNALVSDSIPLVIIATVDRRNKKSLARYEKTIALMRELREQKATIISVANAGDEAVAELATITVDVPPVREALLPYLEVIPLQMLAYFMAAGRGIDVDRPRNLSKAVLEF